MELCAPFNILELKDSVMKFHASGKIQIVEGWKVVENVQSKDRILPKVIKGDVVDVRELNIKAWQT